MQVFLTVALKLSIVVFLVAAMLHIGTSLTLREILEPLRNARLVIAIQVFENPDVLLMITLTVILTLVILLPMAYWLGRHAA